ncbi:MAG: hypothetical protein Q8O89_02510 [Nanoarchaeota archaeon]|nr:hypothetical protein [Nanoarchaeota archaeon]
MVKGKLYMTLAAAALLAVVGATKIPPVSTHLRYRVFNQKYAPLIQQVQTDLQNKDCAAAEKNNENLIETLKEDYLSSANLKFDSPSELMGADLDKKIDELNGLDGRIEKECVTPRYINKVKSKYHELFSHANSLIASGKCNDAKEAVYEIQNEISKYDGSFGADKFRDSFSSQADSLKSDIVKKCMPKIYNDLLNDPLACMQEFSVRKSYPFKKCEYLIAANEGGERPPVSINVCDYSATALREVADEFSEWKGEIPKQFLELVVLVDKNCIESIPGDVKDKDFLENWQSGFQSDFSDTMKDMSNNGYRVDYQNTNLNQNVMKTQHRQ